MNPLNAYYHGLDGEPLFVGRLAAKDGRIYFEYDRAFIARNLKRLAG